MIEFKEGVVCYSRGSQWVSGGNITLYDIDDIRCSGTYDWVIESNDFALNQLQEGWYIPKSELDTEEKYNKAVEVFGLFGFKECHSYGELYDNFTFLGDEGEIDFVAQFNEYHCKTKCTFTQLMAIGELKRKMDERESEAEPIELLSDESMQYKISNIGNMIHNISCSTENEETQDELGDHAFNLWDLAKQVGVLERKELNLENEKNNQIDATQFGKNEDGSMKLVKSNFSANPNGCKDGGKYHREIIGLDGVKTTVDVYRVLDAFKTDCAATDHAVKKMLCAGLRGHKDKLTDYDNAIESLQAAKELLIQKGDA